MRQWNRQQFVQVGIDALDAHNNPLVATNVTSTFVQQEDPIKEPKQGENSYPCVVDLIYLLKNQIYYLLLRRKFHYT